MATKYIYQPDFDVELWDEANFYDHMVFKTKTEAQKMFPTLNIFKYETGDIEGYVFI